jgi:hypothetical protein
MLEVCYKPKKSQLINELLIIKIKFTIWNPAATEAPTFKPSSEVQNMVSEIKLF